MHCAAVWQHSSNWNIKIVDNSIEHFLLSPSDFSSDDVLSCLWILFTNCLSVTPSEYFSNRTLEYLRHNFSWTDTFHVKLITPGHSIPKISTHLTMFWRGNWKTEFVKTSQRQERTSPKKRSDRFRKKCSIESWTTLMFELLLCCHTAIQCMEQT